MGYWLLQPEIWIIFSIGLIILEVTLDGSKIIFLPLGLAAAANSLLLYLQTKLTPAGALHLIDGWDGALIGFAIFAIIFSIILRRVARHHRTDNTPDVNDY